MIKKILITISILTFIFSTTFAHSPGEPKNRTAAEKEASEPLQLNISLFFGITKKEETLKEKKNEELLLLKCKPFNDKKELENHLKSLTAIGPADLTLNRFAHSESVLNTAELEKINWMKDGILMKVSIPGDSAGSLPLTGSVSFFDSLEKKTHNKPFSLKKDECIAALFKKDEKLLVLALQLKDQQEIYKTEFRSEKFTVYCVDHSLNYAQIEADAITFHKAKAIIPVKGDYLVLEGETIVYLKTDESLVADKASLTQPDGTKRSTLGKITIPLNKPLEFKID